MPTKETKTTNNTVLDNLKKIDEHISSLSTKIAKAREQGNEVEVKSLITEGKSYLKEHFKADYQNEFLAKQKELITKEKAEYKEKKAAILEKNTNSDSK